jgi:hypothetical protein
MEHVNALDLFVSNCLKAAVVTENQRARSGCVFENHGIHRITLKPPGGTLPRPMPSAS